MFGIFKNKKKEKPDYHFFNSIVGKLPVKYDFLLPQISDEFILGQEPNRLGTQGSFTFLLNANLEIKYASKSYPNFFIIKDIGVWNSSKEAFALIDLYVLQGMFSGYSLSSEIADLDPDRVDLKIIKEKTFAEADKLKVKEIFGDISKTVDEKLDLEGTFKIDIPEGIFYVIKDFRDGNYLTTTISGAIYLMMHDPYGIEKIFDGKESFIAGLESDNFDLQKFYESKLD